MDTRRRRAPLMSLEETPVRLRTARWYHGSTRDNYLHRSWMKRGLPDDAFAGRPMIGICNSASELAPCNQHLTELAEHVKRGVWESGGVPLEFPVMSLGEAQIQPTAMLLRNLMAMDVEESIRGEPDRRRRAPRRLRQDHAGDGHGRRLGRPAGDHAHRRPDADRPAPRTTARFGHGRVADERGRACGHTQRGGVPRYRIGDDPQRRALQSDGDGVDDGVDGRGARPDACPTTRRSLPPTPVAGVSPTSPDGASSRWCARTSARPQCSPGRRSRTPSGCSPPSADRPTR